MYRAIVCSMSTVPAQPMDTQHTTMYTICCDEHTHTDTDTGHSTTAYTNTPTVSHRELNKYQILEHKEDKLIHRLKPIERTLCDF